MDPAGILDAVTEALDTLASAGEHHDGLFPSITDRNEGRMLAELPEPIPGQRNNDRAFRGSNLMHDHPTLRAMSALAAHTDRERYATAVDRYLTTFATECTDTETGLFPWGEHAFWHLDANEPASCYQQSPVSESGYPVHDHLRLAPEWLWNRLASADPDCLQRYADGLDYHWRGRDRREYCRHAPIEDRDLQAPSGDRSTDFPRHGGHYVHDWAIAYRALPREWPRRHVERMLEYWWGNRTEWDLLSLEARGRTDELSAGQTLSYAISLFDAARLLEDAGLVPGLVDTLDDHAETYVEGFLSAPHDPAAHQFLVTCRARDLRTGEFEPRTGSEVTNEISPMTVWGTVYGGAGDVVAKRALQVCAAYRHTEDPRLLEWAVAAGEYQRSEPFPSDGVSEVGGAETGNDLRGDETVPIIAGDVGQAIGLYVDLYDLTGEESWLESASDLAGTAVESYFDAPLPRAASTLDHYESQTKTGYLLYNLVRLALLRRDGIDVGPDYTDR